jgi:hypothetical protein
MHLLTSYVSPAQLRGLDCTAELITKRRIDRGPEPRRHDGTPLYGAPLRQGYNRSRSLLNTRCLTNAIVLCLYIQRRLTDEVNKP